MKPSEGGTAISLHREIPSDLEEIDPVCREIRSLLKDNGLSAACFSVELVARECLNNAIVHGNRLDTGKKVALNLLIGKKWIHLQIADEGAGFDWRRTRRTPPPDDTTTRGRGLMISALSANRITFNRRGNRVTLRLKKERKGGSKHHDGLHD